MLRTIKQVIVISVFVLGALFVAGFIFWLLNRPSCSDGKKNGDEQGIDCGGSCPRQCAPMVNLNELKVEEETMIKDGERYDVAAKVINTNKTYGFYPLEYRVNLYRASKLVASRQGSSYVMPGDMFYLIEAGIEYQGTPDSMEIVVEKAEPVSFKGDNRPKFDILNQNYAYTREPGSFFETNFQIANRSKYDFLKVDLETVVKNASGEIIAVNRGNINELKSGEVRDFRFFWPGEFFGVAKKVETRARSNFFDLSNL
ncbi:MAG: hypothetical protein ABIC19_00445 [Patescibacteria group bacterium]